MQLVLQTTVRHFAYTVMATAKLRLSKTCELLTRPSPILIIINISLWQRFADTIRRWNSRSPFTGQCFERVAALLCDHFVFLLLSLRICIQRFFFAHFDLPCALKT